MRRFMRSTVPAVTVALALATAGVPAFAAAPEPAGTSTSSAPDCVRLNVGWRYTFVTNDCSDGYSLTVVYRDGTDVPCRWASPGAVLTFPGYGTQGNEVVGAAVCGPGGDA